MNGLVSINRFDRGQIVRALNCLDETYPAGLDWLDRRLDDVEAGKALLFPITCGNEVAALAIETAKGHHLAKLSTFFVLPRFRHLGLGRQLIARLRQSWEDRDLDRVHVTVNAEDRATLRFFEVNGFRRLSDALVSYGENRVDDVLFWTPGAPVLAAPCN